MLTASRSCFTNASICSSRSFEGTTAAATSGTAAASAPPSSASATSSLPVSSSADPSLPAIAHIFVPSSFSVFPGSETREDGATDFPLVVFSDVTAAAE